MCDAFKHRCSLSSVTWGSCHCVWVSLTWSQGGWGCSVTCHTKYTCLPQQRVTEQRETAELGKHSGEWSTGSTSLHVYPAQIRLTVSERLKWSSAFLAVRRDKVAPEWRRIKISFLALVTTKSDIQATQLCWKQSPNWVCACGYTHTNTHHRESLEGPSDSRSWCLMFIPSLYHPYRISLRALYIP